MTPKVVPLFDGNVPPGQINSDVVHDLEQLVARAKRGELIAIAWAGVAGGGSTCTGWTGTSADTYSLGMSIHILDHRYTASVDAEGIDGQPSGTAPTEPANA